MRVGTGTFVLMFMLAATSAFAQSTNLSGRYRCIQMCQAGPDTRAYLTQSGTDINVLDESGSASRAWIDWPGHFWVDKWQEGALVSPDGMTIQFDRGRIWQRDVGVVRPRRVVVVRRN